MKRLFSFLLSVSLLVSVLPMASANGDKGTNVALHRPGFSLTQASGAHADRATDGNTSTVFYSAGGKLEDAADFDATAWFYVDLGAAKPARLTFTRSRGTWTRALTKSP